MEDIEAKGTMEKRKSVAKQQGSESETIITMNFLHSFANRGKNLRSKEDSNTGIECGACCLGALLWNDKASGCARQEEEEACFHHHHRWFCHGCGKQLSS